MLLSRLEMVILCSANLRHFKTRGRAVWTCRPGRRVSPGCVATCRLQGARGGMFCCVWGRLRIFASRALFLIGGLRLQARVCVCGGVVLHGADCPLRRRVLGRAVAECGPSSREGRRRQVNQRVFLELRGIALLLGAIAGAPAIILINTSHLSGEKGLS